MEFSFFSPLISYVKTRKSFEFQFHTCNMEITVCFLTVILLQGSDIGNRHANIQTLSFKII